MRKMFKRIAAMALALIMMTSPSVPVFAETEKNDSYAFEFPFMVAQEEKMIQLYKDGDELYIAHDSVPLLGEITDHVSYFERSDGAAIILEDHNTVWFEQVKYHPFEDIMIALCLNTMYYEAGTAANVKTDRVSLVPANNIFNVVYMGNEVMDYQAINLYGYTSEDFREVEEPKTNIFTTMKKMVGKNLFPGITKGKQDFEDYTCYRTAIWDIMLPVQADIMWTSDYNNDAVGAMNAEAYIYKTGEDVITAFVDKETFISEGVKRSAAGVDIASIDDYLEIVEFVYNISNIDQSFENAFSIIQKLYVSKNENLKKAVNDTMDLYNSNKSPVDLYINHVGFGAVDTVVDTVTGIIELPKAFAAVLDGYDLYQQETYDKSLKNTYALAFGNLGVQEAAGDVFRQQRGGIGRLTTYKERAIRVKDMHDVLMVYLLAGHNVWQAVGDFDEFKDDKAKVIYDIEKKYLAELQKMSYVDFEVYLTAADTKSKLLEAETVPVEPKPEGSVTPEATPAPEATPEAQVTNNQYLIKGRVADYLVTYDAEYFVLSDKGSGKGMKVSFTDELKEDLFYKNYTVDLSKNYVTFEEFHEFYKEKYPLDYYEDDEVQTLVQHEPVSVELGGGLTAVYFDFECTSSKDPDRNIFINRYCYVDLGTGEFLYSHEFTAMQALEKLDITYEEYLQKLYANVEVLPK